MTWPLPPLPGTGPLPGDDRGTAPSETTWIETLRFYSEGVRTEMSSMRTRINDLEEALSVGSGGGGGALAPIHQGTTTMMTTSWLSSSPSRSFGLPPARANGDLMIAVNTLNPASAGPEVFVTPSGWTNIGSYGVIWSTSNMISTIYACRYNNAIHGINFTMATSGGVTDVARKGSAAVSCFHNVAGVTVPQALVDLNPPNGTYINFSQAQSSVATRTPTNIDTTASGVPCMLVAVGGMIGTTTSATVGIDPDEGIHATGTAGMDDDANLNMGGGSSEITYIGHLQQDTPGVIPSAGALSFVTTSTPPTFAYAGLLAIQGA